ncbi:MAG: BON domain-containing protein [Porticoccaceae bacterium]|jgi:osmotically-inducible protein OsmY|nr:BON domain-containing protein [Porticoccaceae bacterium]
MRNIVLVISMAAFLSGCTAVVDSVVKDPIMPDPTSSPIGSDINDIKMDTYIGVNIKKAHPRLKKAHINVHVYHSVVLLTGEVPTKDLKILAGDTARAFNGQRQVHNELQVRGNSSIVARTNDALISAKVATKLTFDSEVKSSNIEVTAEDSVVYLMGKVRRINGEKATAIASETSGVRSVVKVFEYVD